MNYKSGWGCALGPARVLAANAPGWVEALRDAAIDATPTTDSGGNLLPADGGTTQDAADAAIAYHCDAPPAIRPPTEFTER